MPSESHERRFHGDADRLRSPERLALLEVDRVIRLSLEGLSVKRVLDVGTGTGVFAEAFQAEGLEVAAIDANPTLLERARSRLQSVDLKLGRAEAIPFEDDSFGLVFLGHVLHETDVPVKALDEARRVAVMRVVVLEWPFREEEHGPPIEHRLKPESVLEMAERVGLTPAEHLRLSHMDLYRMSLAPSGTGERIP